jgi:hypothetical protein
LSLRRRITYTVVLLCLPVAVLALVEGMAGLAIFARSLLSSRPLAEEGHTEPDTLLGWINLPNVNRPDFYAPGVGLRTNGQRFRHQGELAPRPPSGRRRVVCSGDSFTLGYGVDDADTWCARLGVLDVSLETVNMGQGGYGLDQAYLWYLRDGLPLHAAVHLFAFITADFDRMARKHFTGNPKPQLVRDGDSLRVTGVPVPRPGLGPFMFRLRGAVRALRIFQVINRLSHGPPATDPPKSSEERATWEIARVALRDLARRDSAKGTELLVVLLPVQGDYGSKPEMLRRWLHEAAGRGEFQLLDLIEPFQRIPADSVDAMFIQDGALAFRGAAGHYSRAGNAWAAEQLVRLIPSLTPRAP